MTSVARGVGLTDASTVTAVGAGLETSTANMMLADAANPAVPLKMNWRTWVPIDDGVQETVPVPYVGSGVVEPTVVPSTSRLTVPPVGAGSTV
jgi:hypothetical protein